MKSSTVMAVLVLQAVLLTGAMAFPKCCSNCNPFSGVYTCQDVSDSCDPAFCNQCVQVQTFPVKKFRCDEMHVDDGKCGPPCPTAHKCCSNCSRFNGFYTCNDVVTKCDPSCRNCVVMETTPVKKFVCADTHIDDGKCGPPCKGH